MEDPMFKRVVVGCDGTHEGRDAVALGQKIASATGAGLSLVGVFPPWLFPVPGTTDRHTLRAETERRLRDERRLLAPEAVVEAVADGSVPRALRHYAERWHADLVVIGSDVHSPDGQATVGRRGRQLLAGGPFAVAIARKGLHRNPVGLDTIGVGYDGGPESVVALELAAHLARESGARISVLSVVEDRVPALAPREWIGTKDWTRFWETEREHAQLRVESAVAPLGVPFEVRAVVGDPGLQLRGMSETVDLMVVGSRRWGTLARLASGSVAETLVAGSHCSVLVTRRPATGQVGEDAHAAAEAVPA
jgi:nucleotide-binding universal stress UspA family protein